MKSIFAKTALLPDGWRDDVLVFIGEDGNIANIEIGAKAFTDSKKVEVLLSGMPNTHSHAFQYSMAGMAESKTDDKDSFWTWRKTMYDFVNKITPDDMRDIARKLYTKMLKVGYTSVGEFHYMHHKPDGSHYDDIAKMSKILIDTALEVGISITHLPVLYKYGGFGKTAINEGQKRFINSNDEFIDIVENLQKTYENNPQVKIGMAYHSLRAVDIEDIKQTIKQDIPIHIHIAEQQAEVDDCLKCHGQRPVEYLLNNIAVNENWTLIHTTHINDAEIKALAKTEAVVGLCPTTEANLGDGIFPLAEYLEAGGKISIGSDSHISVNMIEELRWLEYGQRLIRQERTIVDNIYNRNLIGGAKSMGRKIGEISIGSRADFIILDDKDLDKMIFASNNNPIKEVIVGGKVICFN